MRTAGAPVYCSVQILNNELIELIIIMLSGLPCAGTCPTLTFVPANEAQISILKGSTKSI